MFILTNTNISPTTHRVSTQIKVILCWLDELVVVCLWALSHNPEGISVTPKMY